MTNAQSYYTVENYEVTKCKWCGADVCLQVSRRNGKRYVTNAIVRNSKFTTSRSDFHNCKQPEQRKTVLNFAAIQLLFDRAKQHLTRPRVRLLTPSKQMVLLYRAGDKSKYKGQLNVTDGASFGSNIYYGRIDQQGVFHESRDTTPEVRDLLERFSKDPAGVAAACGKLIGSCCFCGRPLEDQRSTEVGYGPVCAENYGLPWGAVSTPTPTFQQASLLHDVVSSQGLRSNDVLPDPRGPWTKTSTGWSAEASELGSFGFCPSCNHTLAACEGILAPRHDHEGEVTSWEGTCTCGVRLVVFND